MKDAPIISVIMPSFNRAAYIAEAVNSILTQTCENIELIVVDDGSTDGSAALMRSFAARDKRVRIIQLSHGGQGRARNAGIAGARGKYIAHMDDDDVSMPERFAVQLEWMRRTNVDICGSCAMMFGRQDGLLWFPEEHEAIRNELVFRCGLLQSTVLMRAETAKSNLYDESIRYDDYEMWTRLAPGYRMGNVQQILLKVRYHPCQTHSVHRKAFDADRRKFICRYLRRIFPRSNAADYAAILRIVEKEPHGSDSELERAGEWLERLARAKDDPLRRQMAERWYAACLRAAPAAENCFSIYRRFAPMFGLENELGTLSLRLACAMRIAPDSAFGKVCRKLGYFIRAVGFRS